MTENASASGGNVIRSTAALQSRQGAVSDGANNATSGSSAASEEQVHADLLGVQLLEAARKDDTQAAIILVTNGANVCLEDGKQWTPLMWSSCNGNVELTRVLISKGAQVPYVDSVTSTCHEKTVEADSESNTLRATGGQLSTNSVVAHKPSVSATESHGRVVSTRGPDTRGRPAHQASQDKKNAPNVYERDGTQECDFLSHNDGIDVVQRHIPAAKRAKHSPLHWAAFKGHLRVLWLLLREGVSPHDKDVLGNSVLHQAAAGGHLETVKCLLSQGTDVFQKNDRGHTALALATTPSVVEVLEKAMAANACKTTGRQFSYKVLRFMCSLTEDFFCHDAVYRTFVHSDLKDTEKERPVTWCAACKTTIRDTERQVSNALSLKQLEAVTQALRLAADKQIDVMLFDKCSVMKTKLENELALTKALQIQEISDLDGYFSTLDQIRKAMDASKKQGGDPAIIKRAQALTNGLQAELQLTRMLSKPNTVNFRPNDIYLRALEESTEHAKAHDGNPSLIQKAERVIGTMHCRT
eukprot:GHVQ01038497.1.p1 GENE.GHVQ01038497.1~~GHVQ01038497.1.p1  ORF type:complete len:527 (+),score=49.89 GHVQ01038497.1:137-1717(+)